MGFKDEIIQARSGTPTPAPAATAAAEPAAAAAEAAPVNDGDAFMLPTGTSPLEGEVVVQAPTVKPGEEPVEPVLAPIKIAGKEFKSTQEAMEYAEQLELARREENAFKEGFEKAKASDKPVVVPKSLDDEVEEMFFEKPKEAIKKLREGIQSEIWSAYNKMTTQQQETAKAEATRQETWNDFYKSNADLAESRDFVEFALKKNWEALKDKPTTAALGELAEIARKGLRLSRENALPKRELQSRGAVMVGAGSSATTGGAAVTSDAPVDFISQLNKLRKRGKQ